MPLAPVGWPVCGEPGQPWTWSPKMGCKGCLPRGGSSCPRWLGPVGMLGWGGGRHSSSQGPACVASSVFWGLPAFSPLSSCLMALPVALHHALDPAFLDLPTF